MGSRASTGARLGAAAVGTGIAAGTVAASPRPAVGVCFLAFVAIVALRVVVSAVTERDDRRLVWRFALAIVAIHVVVGGFISFQPSLVDLLGPDAVGYRELARQLTQHWSEGFPQPELSPGKEGFYHVLAVAYQAVYPWGPIEDGTAFTVGVIVNAALSGAVVPFVYDTAKRLGAGPLARRALWALILLPGFTLWTSQVLREAGVSLFASALLNAAVRLRSRFSLTALSLLVLSTVCLLTFRGYVALVLLSAAATALVLATRSTIRGLALGALGISGVAALVFFVGIGYTGYRLAISVDLQEANRLRHALTTTAESGLGSDLDVSTPSKSLLALPETVPRFLLGPFPQELRNRRQVPLMIDSAAMWIILIGCVNAVRRSGRAGRRRDVIAALIPAAVVTAVLSLLIGNYGTIARERLQVALLAITPLVAASPERKSAKSRTLPRPLPVGVVRNPRYRD